MISEHEAIAINLGITPHLGQAVHIPLSLLFQENSRVPFNGTIEASTLVGQKVTVKYLGGQCKSLVCANDMFCCLHVGHYMSCRLFVYVLLFCCGQTCRQTATWTTCST